MIICSILMFISMLIAYISLVNILIKNKCLCFGLSLYFFDFWHALSGLDLVFLFLNSSDIIYL